MIKSPQIMNTISTGKFDMTFKSMVPIYDDNKFIGMFEVITHFNSIVKQLKRNAIESIVLVDKKYKKQLTKPMTKTFVDDYYIANLNANTKLLAYIQNKTDSFFNNQESYIIDYKFNKVMFFYNIPDIEAKPMGTIITFKNFDEINMHDIELIKTNKTFYLLLFILFMLLVGYYIVSKKVSNELDAKVNERTVELRKKDKLLYEQSKMASLGEMIGNIAHQWRQPLSIISTGATGIKIKKEYDILEDEEFYKICDMINDNAQHLSKTIDDFRNFAKGDSVLIPFEIKQTIHDFLNIVDASINECQIKIVLDTLDNQTIKGYPNELIQSLINIFNNAKDALVENNNKDDRYFFISTTIESNNLIIEIKDNGNGIDENILTKIYDPYFTTKHQSQGTGLGLNMTYNLIVNGMKGDIKAENVEYTYKKKNYKGACFKITLPLS